MKSPNPFLFKALGDLATSEKSNYATTQRGTAISGLKRGHFAGLGADFRTEKSNCADAAGRATTGFLAANRLGKVELFSWPPAAAVRRTDETVTCGALRLVQTIKTPSRLAGRPRRQHSTGIVGTETAPAFRHRAKGALE
jgi:seryl-tRNA synthetase